MSNRTRITPVGLARGAYNKIFGDDTESVFFDDQVLPLILEVVTTASTRVTFVTPYIALWAHLRNALEDAVSRGVAVSFVTRLGEQKQVEDLKWLRGHKIRVYEVSNLHAKIYLNENYTVVSSMNILCVFND